MAAKKTSTKTAAKTTVKANPKKKAVSTKAPGASTTKKTAKKAAAKKKNGSGGAVESEPYTDRGAIVDETSEERSTTRPQGASNTAARVLSGEDERSITDLGDELISGKSSVAATAARVLDEIVATKPEAVVPIIDRYAKAIGASAKRPAQSAAIALPQMARVAPARVARHLPRLKESFDNATPAGKDGLVRTFAGLCTASVAYQKRLEDVLNKGLREADAKTLIAWTEVVLPALKGEPHARARATVEARLGRIPKVHAQKIADFLGIKLRLRYR